MLSAIRNDYWQAFCHHSFWMTTFHEIATAWHHVYCLYDYPTMWVKCMLTLCTITTACSSMKINPHMCAMPMWKALHCLMQLCMGLKQCSKKKEKSNLTLWSDHIWKIRETTVVFQIWPNDQIRWFYNHLRWHSGAGNSGTVWHILCTM